MRAGCGQPFPKRAPTWRCNACLQRLVPCNRCSPYHILCIALHGSFSNVTMCAGARGRSAPVRLSIARPLCQHLSRHNLHVKIHHASSLWLLYRMFIVILSFPAHFSPALLMLLSCIVGFVLFARGPSKHPKTHLHVHFSMF